MIVVLDCPEEQSGSLAQYGRIFAVNYLPKLDELNDVYLITGDADLFPLDKRFHVLPDGIDIVMTNTIAGKFPKIREKRSLAEKQPDWVDKIVETHSNSSVRWARVYAALSCVGAKVKTWRQLLNFEDCDENYLQNKNVRKIPLINGSHSDRIYRYFDKKSGCFKKYVGAQSYNEIIEYLKDSVDETAVMQKTEKKSSVWYIDQRILSFRISQWGKTVLVRCIMNLKKV